MKKINIVVSPKYQLMAEDIYSIFKGVIIMALGSGSISALEYLSRQDFGQWTPILSIITAASINAIRKLLTERKYIK